MPLSSASDRRGTDLLLLLVLSSLWGASYTFIRLGVATIPPITLIAARTCIAGGALLLVLRLRGVSLPSQFGIGGISSSKRV